MILRLAGEGSLVGRSSDILAGAKKHSDGGRHAIFSYSSRQRGSKTRGISPFN